MPLDRETTARLEHLANRVTNGSARGVVLLVDDSKDQQLLQIGVLDGEALDGAEHCQPYGFSAVPLAGAEHVVVFPGGDRGHPLVIAVPDRRYRPTGGEPGEVTVYNNTGASIRITKDGDIHAQPAPGRAVLIDDGSGSHALPTLDEFNNHTHPAPGGATGMPTDPATGTTVLKAK